MLNSNVRRKQLNSWCLGRKTIAMPLDIELLQAAEELRVPVMGSETLAPLLYFLVRFTRPRKVLEVGTGYTTPFIARALADNMADYQRSSIQLAAKSRHVLNSLSNNSDPDARRRQEEQWAGAEPALAAPKFYAAPYEPKFLAIDSLTLTTSSAPKVCSVLSRLRLREAVTVIDGEFQTVHDKISPDFLPFDFAWVDCDHSLEFFDQYWQDINPQDGLLVFHWLLTDRHGEVVLDYIKTRMRVHNDLEIVSFCEPHKIAQNSLTIIRKTAIKNRTYDDKSALLQDTVQFLRNFVAQQKSMREGVGAI